MLEIDGSIGEGGGQVLRTALSVACVLGKPVRITNIRAGRETPGLRAQHLTVCKLLAEITGGKLSGASLGSSEITFSPGKISGGGYSFDIGTAGSCTLLLQSALPVLLSAKGECLLKIRGGTHVRGAPTYDYFSEVFLPAVKKFGAECGAKMLKAGFYPKGGGEIEVRCSPSKFVGAGFAPEQHKAARYRIISSGLPAHVAQREEEKIREVLPGIQIAGEKVTVQSACAGNAITIWSGSSGASSLGEAGVSAEKVAQEA